MSKPSFSFFISLLLVFILVVPGLGQTRSGKFGVGVDGSMQYVLGAGVTNPSAAFGGGLSLSYSVTEYFGMRSNLGVNQLSWKGSNTESKITDLMTLSLYLSADLMPYSDFNIFPFFGAGMVFYDPRDNNGNRAYDSTGTPVSSFGMTYGGGVGFDYFFDEFWSITLMGEYVMTNSQYFSGCTNPLNVDKDSFARINLQIRYYFFDQPFIMKLLEAQRERMKRK